MLSDLLLEYLIVLKVLPERLQEQPELPELEEVVAVLAVVGRLVLGVVERLVDGTSAVELLQLVSKMILQPAGCLKNKTTIE